SQAPEARPCGVEGQLRPGQQGGDPDPDEHAEDRPGHGEDDSEADGIVVILVKPTLIRFGRVDVPQKRDHDDGAENGDEKAVIAQNVIAAGDPEGCARKRDEPRKPKTDLSFSDGQSCDHSQDPFFYCAAYGASL